jgi:hypothetical protein
MAFSDKEILLNISEKVDNLVEKVDSIENSTIKNTLSLDEHMRRTNINEEKLEVFEEKIAPALEAYKFVATGVKWLIPIFTLLGICYEYFLKK